MTLPFPHPNMYPLPLHYTKEMLGLLAHKQPKSKCEVFVNDEWLTYDGHGTNTSESRKYYKHMTPIAEGSLPTRYNGTVAKQDSTANSVFYRSNN